MSAQDGNTSADNDCRKNAQSTNARHGMRMHLLYAMQIDIKTGTVKMCVPDDQQSEQGTDNETD